jgi:hypothetical protein
MRVPYPDEGITSTGARPGSWVILGGAASVSPVTGP